MKKFTTLVMGSAAAVSMLASGAQAADPPLDEPAVAVCDAFGTGFWAIPGTSNCIKISGEIRADYTYSAKIKDRSNSALRNTGPNPNHAATTGIAAGTFLIYRPHVYPPVYVTPQPLTSLGARFGSVTHPAFANFMATASTLVIGANNDGTGEDLAWSSRFRFNVDVQSMTEWGALRAFARFQGGGGGSATVDKAYVQFAGLTAGWNTSNFAFDDVNDTLHGNAYDGPWDTHMLAYTFAAGNGITATLALEDPANSDMGDGSANAITPHTMGAILALVPNTPTPPRNFRNQRRTGVVRDRNIPDVVAAFQVEQSWGKVKLAGIYHAGEARLDAMPAMLAVASPVTPLPLRSPAVGATPWQDYSGYGVTLGTAINLPALSGAVFSIAGSYGVGLNRAIGMGAVIGHAANGTRGGMPDVTIDAAGNLHKTKGWSISTGVDLKVSDQVTLNLAGGYLDADNDINDPTYADLGLRAYALGASVKWSPVPDFGISLGVAYDHAEYSAGHAPVENGFVKTPSTVGPPALSEQDQALFDQNAERKISAMSVRLRVERDF